jgi:hypothetical protein
VDGLALVESRPGVFVGIGPDKRPAVRVAVRRQCSLRIGRRTGGECSGASDRTGVLDALGFVHDGHMGNVCESLAVSSASDGGSRVSHVCRACGRSAKVQNDNGAKVVPVKGQSWILFSVHCIPRSERRSEVGVVLRISPPVSP